MLPATLFAISKTCGKTEVFCVAYRWVFRVRGAAEQWIVSFC